MRVSVFTDHQGKPSQGRLAALLTTVSGCILALAPLWGGPEPDTWLVAMLLGIAPGAAVYQKISAPQETK